MDDDNTPNEEDLLDQEIRERAKKLLIKQWYDTREGKVMRRVETRPHLTRLYAALLADQQRFVDAMMELTVEDLYDEREYYKNPMKYHGLPGGFL